MSFYISDASAIIPVKVVSLLESQGNKAVPVSARSVPPQLSCPSHCYHPSNDYNRLKSWCQSQYWCRQGTYSNYNSYGSSYSSCPYYCWDPGRDGYKMRQWCQFNNVCSQNSYNSPQNILSRNYGIRDYTWQKVGQEIRFSINSYGTNYTWKVTGLPRGADFDGDTLTFKWKPKSWDVGTTYMTFHVTDGKDTASKTIKFKIKEEWESFFLPGVGYSVLFPQNNSDLGVLHGISLNYVFFSWIHRNEKRGPSHGRLYFKLDILNTTKKTADDPNNLADDMLYWAFGVDLSFERNPKRPFLIPWFGLEIGGSYSTRKIIDEETNLPKEVGGIFHMTPTFGVHLYTDRNLFVSLTGAYTFAIGDHENLSGWKVTLGLNYSMW